VRTGPHALNDFGLKRKAPDCGVSRLYQRRMNRSREIHEIDLARVSPCSVNAYGQVPDAHPTRSRDAPKLVRVLYTTRGRSRCKWSSTNVQEALLVVGCRLRLHVKNCIRGKPVLAEIAGIAKFPESLLRVEIRQMLKHRHPWIIRRQG
jgi:hypothetical protein